MLLHLSPLIVKVITRVISLQLRQNDVVESQLLEVDVLPTKWTFPILGFEIETALLAESVVMSASIHWYPLVTVVVIGTNTAFINTFMNSIVP